MPAPQSALVDKWPRDLPRTTTYAMLRKAIRVWAQGGNDVQVAEWLNCRPEAVRRFRESDGWATLARDMRKELDFDLESSFGRLGFKALEQLEDRLRYGDYYITKTGEPGRRPLSADQLSKITATLFDRRAEVRHLVDGTVSDSQQERKSDLALIADALRNHAQNAPPAHYTRSGAPQTIDVTPTTPVAPAMPQNASNP
jgi:hypothetical protein